MSTKNALIKQVYFCEDRGFTLNLLLELEGGGSQCFGGWRLIGPNKEDYTGRYIQRLFEVVGIQPRRLEDLVGKVVRVKGDDYRLLSIGHPIEDIWFTPGEEIDRFSTAL